MQIIECPDMFIFPRFSRVQLDLQQIIETSGLSEIPARFGNPLLEGILIIELKELLSYSDPY